MNKTSSGFTIVELLIVIVVIAILAAISIVAYNGITTRANDATVQADLRNSYSKLAEYEATEGSVIGSGNNTMSAGEQSAINETFVTTRSAYHRDSHNLLYCRSNSAYGILALSVSGKGFYYSSVSGAGEVGLPNLGGRLNADLCPLVGVESGAPGRGYMWLQSSGVWRPWFTPGQ